MNKNISYVVVFISVIFSVLSKAEPLSSDSNSQLVPAFTAQYTITRNHDAIGTAVRQLRYLSPELAEYSYSTNLEWFIFSDKRSETSVVKINKDQLTPTHYIFKREGTGTDKSSEWTYDIKNNSAKDVSKNKDKKLIFPENIQDKLSYHLQNRLNLITSPEQKHFVYPVISTSGKIKNYEYEYDGEEDLMLPYGLVKSLRFKRVVTKKNQVTYAWFSPELNYVLVKLRLEKEGVQQFEAQLDTLTR